MMRMLLLMMMMMMLLLLLMMMVLKCHQYHYQKHNYEKSQPSLSLSTTFEAEMFSDFHLTFPQDFSGV